ncbi:MAG: EutN/CcmL family microcompartment protein [Acidimicrobiia bacterium]|nr:EutN/CcmL family microcompartment protein [Acidimicrobiia bacterium]
MKLGRVSGTVVSTINHPVYDDRRLLLVDLVGPDGEDTGDYLICVDAVGAGAGEQVLVLDEGNGARQVVGWPGGPIRAVVIGIVDDVEVARPA